MKEIGAFFERRPLLSYFVLTFAFRGAASCSVVGPAGFGSTDWQAEGLFLPAVMVMLAGPSGVYDRTGSLLVVTLMHASLTARPIFVFSPLATGIAFLADGWLLAAALWIVVGIVALANGGRLDRDIMKAS